MGFSMSVSEVSILLSYVPLVAVLLLVLTLPLLRAWLVPNGTDLIK
jgi:hypothetical protein